MTFYMRLNSNFGWSRQFSTIIALLLSAWVTAIQGATIPPTSFLSNFEPLQLIDQNGKPFQPERLIGQVVLVSFIYTSCGATCPAQTHALAQILRALPSETRSQVQFVSISIDPTSDTPAKLKQFATRLDADEKDWLFLTGNSDQISQLTQRLNLSDNAIAEQNRLPTTHSSTLWLVDKQGRMLQRYKGDPPDAHRLIKEISLVSTLPPSKLKID